MQTNNNKHTYTHIYIYIPHTDLQVKGDNLLVDAPHLPLCLHGSDSDDGCGDSDDDDDDSDDGDVRMCI